MRIYLSEVKGMDIGHLPSQYYVGDFCMSIKKGTDQVDNRMKHKLFKCATGMEIMQKGPLDIPMEL
jgi:hypothetical protein